MTSGESTEQTPILKITQDMYASLPTGELVLFAVQHLHADGVPASAEEIVSICFKLFPRRFSLKNYFYWPDSAHVAQALKYAKEKGYIKEAPADGYILRPAGRKLARQAAKAMGIPFPVPPKPKQVEKAPEPVVQSETKKAAAPAKKKKQVKKVVKKKIEAKKAKPAKQSGVRELAPVPAAASRLTPKAKPKAKKVVRKKRTVEKTVVPAKKKTMTKPAAKKPVRNPASKKKAPVRKTVKKTQVATQLPLPVPAVPKKEAKSVVRKKPQSKVKKEAKSAIAAPSVSKEEKVKAGKVIKMVERSDAYRQYKKLGSKARISEFDFRDMLFATMESSAETLRRNVGLFKRYAGIHSRADLITFLEFCEGGFAPLLKSQVKHPARKR